MNWPRVTILMPVYNAEANVAAATESILEQTYTDFEFLIIDDGSTDNSLAVITEYAKADRRIRVISCANRGLVTSLNEGLAESRGSYIARMDADDIAMPSRLREQVAFLDENDRCAVVGTSFILIDDHGNVGTAWRSFIHDLTIKHALALEGCICHPTATYRKSAVLDAGGYREAYVAAEDYDLWRRLARIGELHNLSEPLLYKRESPAAVSARLATIQHQSAERIRREVWMDNFFTGYRRVPLSKLVQLPGEHPPTLRSLQKDLAIFAIRRGDIRLFSYLCWDLLRFQRDFRRYGLEADTSPQDPESGQASAKAKGG
jgi:glycosyltransferase involved in cell wall biosynthesis